MTERMTPPNEQAVLDKIRPSEHLNRKPILCLDFDGVLHSYASGWQGASIVPDLPVPGAVEFLHAAAERFRVAIHSSRSAQPGGIEAMRGWLTLHVMAVIDDRREAEHLLNRIEWPTEKPPAVVTLDDRALTFTGTWPSLDEIAAFKPWNKRPPHQNTARPKGNNADEWAAWFQEHEGYGSPYLAVQVAEALDAAAALDRKEACRAAAVACKRFGQWVPQQWLELFMDAYGAEQPLAADRAPATEGC